MSNESHMRAAIDEARKAMGRTHPNPAVGAAIVHQGTIVARGHTQPAGSDHAEIVALKAFREAGIQPDHTTELVVTLEPCSTEGRTGACTAAIIASGIRKVVIGATDPNPAHAGRGFDVLRAAGISVEAGLLAGECTGINLIFNWRMEHGGPFFAGKIATTIDGRIATRGGLSKWITGPRARADVHQWRRYFPAIAVGAGTVLADDPALTARLDGEPDWCPVRFVFDRNLITFREKRYGLYTDEWKDRTIVISSRSRLSQIQRLESEQGLQFWPLEENLEDGGLSEFAARCREAGIDGVMVEGGASLLSSFIKYRYLHYLFAYRAPKLLADSSGLAPFMGLEPFTMQDTITLHEVLHASFGDDQLMRGFVVYPDP
ncbi:MAG TPA: bifunctional diaminohydroxyphosphoribosylaminopyrimidine deaminase/5-amino-6-(5-phosphoribosylamino)uracil reductase RibD [Oceanipulchritudo sp.]|nr:bifunctional diaminohydroxyphosphoribosylaminopyrimidine deaminase/5-amino-6-(5-phosphoribosylamino)uracil reductase RibD [Oceanipulchritudo sp.]